MTADLVLQLIGGGGLVAGIAALAHFLFTRRGTIAKSEGAKAAHRAYVEFIGGFESTVMAAAEETADVLVRNPVAVMTALLAGDEDKPDLGIVAVGEHRGHIVPLGVDNRYHVFACTCDACTVISMTWCAGCDRLTGVKSMAWTEDGQRWRCSTCRKPEAVLEPDAHDAIKVATAVHDGSMASIIPLFPSVPTTPPVDPHDTPSPLWTRAQLDAEALRRGFDTTSPTAFPTKATVVQLLTDTADPNRCVDCEMFGPQHCVPEAPGAWKARLFEQPECDGRRGNHGHPDVVCAECCECPPDPMGFDCTHEDDEPDDWSDPHEVNGAFGL